MRTRVCISVDTEFSIAGAFGRADRQPVGDPMVWCEVDGRSQGLGFLLEQFGKHDIPATFFVETVHRCHFRDDPMAPIARLIVAQGHEVQLHTHPCWAVFRHEDWRERVRQQPDQDDFVGRAEADTVALLRQGQAAFADWGVPAPTVFRAGNLQHDDALYAALARCGIPASSCIGLAVFDSHDPGYRLYSGTHWRHGVLELPVLTFQDWAVGGRQHLKTLTVAGSSFAEMRLVLERAHAVQLPLVVLLTHPFEYVQRRGDGMGTARVDALHQDRLARLCTFLDGARDRFLPVGMGDAAAALRAVPDERNVLLQGSAWLGMRRLVEGAVNDRYGHWALARRQVSA
ncbi:polysaccharide deacetylase [Pseudoduganella lurida]|uniref:Polysaccharide deacetylase n=1 Tax=Pseudoduganella lurida TaxID=1036180 RepID=A0A562R1P9_9BURK|nr:polysaccharide deacetylase family protein [Pseudoduganella lurida]TWI62988.1 polysaccharide deacetylase [Pseudoduganella lurida]